MISRTCCSTSGTRSSLWQAGLETALALRPAKRAFDVAMLDVNLAGQASFQVAEVLRARGIPIFSQPATGLRGIAEAHPPGAVLQKPFRAQDLEEMLRAAAQPDQPGRRGRTPSLSRGRGQRAGAALFGADATVAIAVICSKARRRACVGFG
jgi:CheY-like chemotaxis protein